VGYWTRSRPVQRRRAVRSEDLGRVACEILDASGGAALTTRAVAARLGVAPASLYSRIREVDDLADLALDHALGTDTAVAQAIEGADLVQLLTVWHDHLLRHPWAVAQTAKRPPLGPAYLALSDRLCELASELGDADPLPLTYAMSNYVLGCALTRSAAEADPDVPREALAAAPHLAAARCRSTVTADEVLRRGLQALLAGAGSSPPEHG
jgi:AcrR family transcriptional regulator